MLSRYIGSMKQHHHSFYKRVEPLSIVLQNPGRNRQPNFYHDSSCKLLLWVLLTPVQHEMIPKFKLSDSTTNRERKKKKIKKKQVQGCEHTYTPKCNMKKPKLKRSKKDNLQTKSVLDKPGETDLLRFLLR